MSSLKLSKITVDLPRPTLDDIPASIQSQFESTPIDLKPNASVAIAVGSRGIANLSVIVKCVIDQLKARNWRPFIVPAMGSHGGATAEGQREVLAAY
ncbi:hypothetical protein N8642_03045, partial [bacterium]|nr:hypothetical protein [bacterium]